MHLPWQPSVLIMFCDPLEAQQAASRDMHDERFGKTHRSPTAGLVTQGSTKFRYARVTKRGKIHKVMNPYVRWSVAPFPQITWVLKCGGGQALKIFPVAEGDIDLADLCARCFVVRDVIGEQR